MTGTDLVGELNPTGAEDNQPPVSQGEDKPIASQAPQSQDFVSKKEFDTLMKELRGLQSRQDKTQTEQARFMTELREQMAKGLSLDEAEKAVNANKEAREKDELLIKIAQKVGVLDLVSQQPPAGNGGTATVDVAKVVKEYGLDGNDPEVISSILSQSFNSETDAELAAARILRRRANPNTPSPAASTAAVGSPATVKMSANEADALYGKLRGLLKNPTQNVKEIQSIEKRLRENGYDT